MNELDNFSIALFSPDDHGSIYKDGGFMGRTYPVSGFGGAKLVGYREPDDSEFSLPAVALLKGQLIRAAAAEFIKMRLSLLEILLKFPAKVNHKNLYACILLPENSVLMAKLQEDPALLNSGSNYDYTMPDTIFSGYRYKVKGFREIIRFFVPEDPNFLSSLRFSFSFS